VESSSGSEADPFLVEKLDNLVMAKSETFPYGTKGKVNQEVKGALINLVYANTMCLMDQWWLIFKFGGNKINFS
jgi:hypothetical protein